MTNRSCRCSNLFFSTIRLKVCMVWSCVDSILCSRRINSFSLILTIPGCPSCASVRTRDLNLLGITILVNELVDYVHNQWINTNTFPPRSWSVHGQPVCTNNDIEGWHNSLDRRAGGRVIYLSTYWFSCSIESPLCALSKFNSSMPENFKGSRIKNIVHFKQESLATGKTVLPVKFQVGDFLKHALT